ncbi:hypothetical protein KBTX_03911 [wastewater metagenome]|uniref:DUF1850 domain-containing protein n=3 Tax=root TaxID=1 RepID=A0A5B8RHR5_9ZZZZ|nr:hypothetical protein KBTEX_03911 [uncultured organism]
MARKRRGLILATAVIGGIAAVFVWPQSWLLIRHNGDLRYVYPAQDGTTFALRWTHSVERENWIERFRLHNGQIMLIGTRFKTFGAGVPAHAGKRTTLENGWVVMSGIDRIVDPLAVQAAAAENYSLRYDGAWHALGRQAGAPILTFAYARAPLYRVLPTLIGNWIDTRGTG